MKLQERLPKGVTVNGRYYRMNFDFRGVLRMMEILQRDDILLEARDYLALKCLTKHPRNVEPVIKAVKELLFESKPTTDGKKVTSFEQDAGMIRTAFRQNYGINLFTDKLHWLEFVELLNNLPEGSRYAEVIGIRMKPLPEPTKYNRKERESLMRAKAAVALHMTDNEREHAYDSAVRNIFGVLMKIAEGSDNHAG